MFGINNAQNQPAQTTNVMGDPSINTHIQETPVMAAPTAPTMPNPVMTPPKLTLNPLPPAPQHAPNPLQNVNLEKKEPLQPQPSPPTEPVNPPTPTDDDSLLQIKQQALQSLSPLVDKLDQDPEEKFKTIMMLIQASDNPQLIPAAYEAANKITDEKSRAQALLDVVNEINYFTHKGVDVPKVS